MKELNQYLIEALINKNTKINHIIDVDNLINDNFILYDDSEEPDDIAWEDCKREFKTINKKYDYFLLCKHTPIMKWKNPNNIVIAVSDDLERLYHKVITGRDYGYAVRMVHGHIEIDCINSGSRVTYYIYAISENAYNKIDEWEWGDIDPEDFDFTFLYKEEGNVIPIEI